MCQILQVNAKHRFLQCYFEDGDEYYSSGLVGLHQSELSLKRGRFINYTDEYLPYQSIHTVLVDDFRGDGVVIFSRAPNRWLDWIEVNVSHKWSLKPEADRCLRFYFENVEECMHFSLVFGL